MLQGLPSGGWSKKGSQAAKLAVSITGASEGVALATLQCTC
jgi:hypothetical protein